MRVTIVGLGTVGTSLGMALRQAVIEKRAERIEVVGYDETARSRKDARLGGAVDRESDSLEKAVQEADIVIIATPPQKVGQVLQQIGPHLRPGCIVTDTASTKSQVLRWAGQFLPPTVSFIGGHPIFAPQHEVNWAEGTQGASPDLFRESLYCLAPAPTASEEAVSTIHGLVDLIGASPYYLDAAEHDGLLAGASQAPYVLVAAMLQTMAVSASWREVKLLVDGSFRHLSWPLAARVDEFYQACLTNRPAVISWLDRVIATLGQIRRELAEEGGSGDTLRDVLEEAHAAREDWLRRRDEREGEAGSKAQIESAGQQLLHLFIPRLRRRPDAEEEE